MSINSAKKLKILRIVSYYYNENDNINVWSKCQVSVIIFISFLFLIQ